MLPIPLKHEPPSLARTFEGNVMKKIILVLWLILMASLTLALILSLTGNS